MRILWLSPLFNVHREIRDRIEFIDGEFPKIVGPWLPIMVNILKKKSEIELHIICSYKTIKKDLTITDGNVTYYFINQKVPLLNLSYPHLFKYFSKYYVFRRKVQKIVRDVKPEIINLHGTEHDLSIAINDFDIPKIVTIQGLIHSVYENNKSKYYKRILKNEVSVFEKCNNFGVRAKFLEDIITKYNRNAKFYWYYYPFMEKISKTAPKCKEEFDIIFAARICRDKGIVDLIEACKIIIKEREDLTVRIFGSGDENYITSLLDLIKGYGLDENIKIVGFIQDHTELQDNMVKAKLCVLPTYHDVMPGTIIESLILGTPVISYDIPGIVDFNKNQEIVRLAEKGNIEDLSTKILKMLRDNDDRIALSYRAKEEAINRFDNEKNINIMLEYYQEVINKHEM